MLYNKELEQKLKGLKAGDHLCCIYETDEEYHKLITPFISGGLQLGEKVIQIVDVDTANKNIGYLYEDELEVDNFLKTGQLRILSATESYIRNNIFDPEGMISLLKEETDQAISGRQQRDAHPP